MKIYLVLIGLLAQQWLHAQPKREHRGAWIATYANIDWPSSSTLSATAQQNELIAILDHHKRAGINVVYLQVRSQCDALYSSAIEPWSAVLSGTQGNNPGYDALQFAIAECRKRGIEVHAWFNPYRAIANFANINNFATNHVARVHPEWLLSYGSLRVLNPGLPAVQQYILSVVEDVLNRYDVDGIHYDDYFYPYPQTGVPFYNDTLTYQTYGTGFANIDDWRRSNIDSLIKKTYDRVKTIKPWVKYGVSPFGIWQNQSASALGSATSGLQSYSATYSNSRKWMEQNWVDYMTPQIYWSIGFTAANYQVLANWWNNNAFGRQVYTGNAIYKVNADADANWTNPSQIPDQLRLNRSLANVLGSCFYNTKTFRNNALGVRDSVQQFFFNKPALLPTMAWRDNIAPAPASNATTVVTGNHVTVQWQRPATTTNELDKARQFVVYRSNSSSININDVNNIRIITAKDTTAFTDSSVAVGTWYYGITSVDRFNNESALSNIASAVVSVTPVINLAAGNTAIKQLGPNPFRQQISWQMELKQISKINIQLLSADGRLVWQQNLGSYRAGNHTINLAVPAQLSAGNYLLNILINNSQHSIPLVRQ
jgi:uncharacterized lipoprotein YddW (UPF0748 family)